MMKLACNDIDPDLECDFEAKGNSATEVAKKVLTHVKQAHPEKMKGMSDAEMMKMLESKVHQ